jgi:hypothetical protein
VTQDEAFNEIATLASLEHAFLVECLSVQCALGHDLEAADGGATDPRGREAADLVAMFAVNTLMSRFRRLNFALVNADRPAQLDRAVSVESDSHGTIALDPPSAADLERLVEREHAIADAIDARYSNLHRALEASATGIDPEVLDGLKALVEDGNDHVAFADRLRDTLGAPVPDDSLRATRRQADGSFEQRLLDLADRSYRLVIALLREQFVKDSFVSQDRAVDAMFILDDSNRVLVQRGLLPPFSPA